jgi:DNA-directed RNA polymerase beta' subunit
MGTEKKPIKVTKKYDTAYSKLSEVKLITIGLASPEKIRQWAEKTLPNGKVLGQVTNANTLHHKTFKPQKGGLFCERIFGPLKDFQCACGTIVSKPQLPSLFDITKTSHEDGFENEKQHSFHSVDSLANQQSSNRKGNNKGKDQNQPPTLQGPKAQNSRRFCHKCDVEYTWSVIRRYQLGYIELVSPVTHLWYLKGNPSYLSILLDMKKRHIEYVTYCTESMTLENSIKGINQNRFNKIPSQMLLNWENTVITFSSSPKLSLNNETFLKTKKISLTGEKTRVIGIEERKKQKRFKTNVQKRLLPLLLLNSINQPLGKIQHEVNLANNKVKMKQLEPIKILRSKESLITNSTNQKFLILLSLIHKSILESLSFDCLKVEPSLGQPANIERPLKSLSIKKLLKKLPASLYLFLTLQFCFEKQFLMVTQNQLWKDLYRTSLKTSIKNFFFLSGSTFFINPSFKKADSFSQFKKKQRKNQNNHFSYNVAKKMLNLQTQTSTSDFNVERIAYSLPQKNQQLILFIETVKMKWFFSFLTFVKKLRSENLLNFNTKLMTSYELTNQKTIEILSQEWIAHVHMDSQTFRESQNSYTNLYFPSSPKISDFQCPNSYLPNPGFLISKIQKYNKTLLHAFFIFLVKEKTHNSSVERSWQGQNPPGLGLAQKLRINKAQSQIENLSFHKGQNGYSNLELARFGPPFLRRANQFPNRVQKRNEQTEKGSYNTQYNLDENKILLTKIKKQYLFLAKLINPTKNIAQGQISSANLDLASFAHSKTLIGRKMPIEVLFSFSDTNQGFSGEYLWNQSLSQENQEIQRKSHYYQKLPIFSKGTSVLLSPKGKEDNQKVNKASFSRVNMLDFKEQTFPHKLPKLVNQIYSLSHRERWMDEEWQNFIDYMSVPFKNWQASVLFNELKLSQNLNESRAYSLPKKRNSSYEKIKDYSLIPAYKNLSPFNWQSLEWSKAKGGLPLIQKDTSNTNFVRNNYAFFSGPGIIQQLLNEFDFSELQKIDKQNRILLYQLNKHIFLLKKRIKKSARKELKECYKKRDQLIRRTKLIRTFFRKDSKPNSMILTILPVLPPDLRPIVKIGGQIAASDLNRLYQRVIYRNDRLRKFLKEPATSSSYEMKYAQRLLQEAVDNLIQNGKSGTASEKDARGRALKSLSDLLKGKQGRFRQYLLGKRVDYSGRSVIVVGPKLKLHECGLPKEMALELYFPFLLKRIINHNYARTVVGAKALMKKNPDLTWELLKEIMQTCPILLNRAPTLHRLGIQAFQPKLIEGRAILLHPLVCPAFNADFDGDQMAVHVPITVEARAEAWKLMCARQNFLSPATGEPLAIPSQDMVLGCYYLTTYSNKFSIKHQKGSGFSFSHFSDVLNAYRRQIIDLHSLVWVKFDGHLEQENQLEATIELRINSYGNWNEIYQFIQKNYSQNQTLVNQYICTTPGRILFNLIVQKTLFGLNQSLFM